MKILAFESSCDETAVAVVEDGRTVLSDAIASQADLHALYGGVVPEIASRKHVEAIAGLADQALARAGLQRDDAAPRLLVQLGVQADAVPRYDPFRPYGPYGAYGPGPWGMGGWYGRGWGVHGVWRFGEPTPLHRRAVSIVMRDASTQAVVYETSAVHEDVWVSDPAVYGVLFDAALNGFPKPPEGPRQVRIPLAPPAP